MGATWASQTFNHDCCLDGRALSFDVVQSVDQAAYRKGFSVDDHLLTVSKLIEKSHEFNHPLWIALVDFEKAFDTIDHPTLWKVLQTQGVPSHYVALLQSIV